MLTIRTFECFMGSMLIKNVFTQIVLVYACHITNWAFTFIYYNYFIKTNSEIQLTKKIITMLANVFFQQVIGCKFFITGRKKTEN